LIADTAHLTNVCKIPTVIPNKQQCLMQQLCMFKTRVNIY